MSKLTFKDLLLGKDGIIKGPFGGDIKKSLFVPQSKSAYKVYEQGVVLNKDVNYGNYYISVEHFKKSLSRFEVLPGDILMTGAGTLGELFEVKNNNPKGVINQALLRIRLDENVINRNYFKFYFKHFIKSLISKINGDSVIPNLPPLTIIRNVEVNIVDISTQQKIAAVLSALDDKIELNNKINAELEAMVKTLYDYWFVQFDFADANGKPYKSSGGKMVYNEILKRKIPEAWEVKELGEISSILVRGVSPKYIENEGIIVLNQKCIRNKTVDYSFARRHDNLVRKVESKLIQVGDILVNSTGVGTLGRLALVKKLDEALVTVDSHVTIVRINDKKANKYYAGYSLTEKQSEIEGFGVGSTGQTELSRVDLGKVLIVLPNDSLQKLFESLIKVQIQKVANSERQNQQLSTLRDWLLPMLMNGQVSLGRAYEQVEEVLSVAAEDGIEHIKKYN